MRLTPPKWNSGSATDCLYWWLVKVTLVVGFVFCPTILGMWWGTVNAISNSMNIDGVVVLLEVDGNTSTHILQSNLSDCFLHSAVVGIQKPRFCAFMPFLASSCSFMLEVVHSAVVRTQETPSFCTFAPFLSEVVRLAFVWTENLVFVSLRPTSHLVKLWLPDIFVTEITNGIWVTSITRIFCWGGNWNAATVLSCDLNVILSLRWNIFWSLWCTNTTAISTKCLQIRYPPNERTDKSLSCFELIWPLMRQICNKPCFKNLMPTSLKK